MNAALLMLKRWCAWIPGWLWAGFTVLALATTGVLMVQRDRVRTAYAEFQNQVLAERLQMQLQARAREAALQSAIDMEAGDAQQEIIRLQADLDTARVAADGLRAAAASAARRAGPGAGIAAAGAREPDSRALDLLADLLGRSGARNAELAGYADQLRIAGTTCERAYDAMTGEAMR